MVVTQKLKPRRNYSSRLLSKEESSQLDRLIGPQYQSIVSTVVQLFTPEPPHYTQWMKNGCGVLCLVEDKRERHRWLKMYCLIRRKILWERKLHGPLIYRASTPFFHTLSAADNTQLQVGFNFADESEAAVVLRVTRAYLLKKKGTFTRNGSFKLDISPPTDFRVISHIGWDQQRGFLLHNVDHQLFQTFLDGIGNRVKGKQDLAQPFDHRTRFGSCRRKKVTKSDISLPVSVQLIQGCEISSMIDRKLV